MRAFRRFWLPRFLLLTLYLLGNDKKNGSFFCKTGLVQSCQFALLLEKIERKFMANDLKITCSITCSQQQKKTFFWQNQKHVQATTFCNSTSYLFFYLQTGHSEGILKVYDCDVSNGQVIITRYLCFFLCFFPMT